MVGRPVSRFLCLVLCSTLLPAQQPVPAGFEKPDHEIEIGVLPARLRFDKERFTVAPGNKVKLTLVNNDSMQHNLLICKPGKDIARKVGMLALQLGAQASEKDFVPDTQDVLFHTRAILPGEKDTIWFTAPRKPGAYPYVCTLPGHMFTMIGVMQVGDVPPQMATPIDDVRYRVYEGQWKLLPDFSALEPASKGVIESGVFDLAPLKRRTDYGVRFDGVLHIEKPGRYTFMLNSDDGSRLFVDGAMVTEWDGVHGGGKARTGEVELTAGPHDLRLDFFQGGGGQLLQLSYKGPGVKRTELSAKPTKGPPAGIPIAVHHAPRVLRVHVEGATARSIAVGLPGGTNYCFDADRCSVQFGWAGAFLDVGPDREGRGGRPCKTLGPRFDVGDLGFPLRVASGAELPVRFRGYRIGAVPSFLLDWGGREVIWTISALPSSIGLRYTFTIPEADRGIRFAYDPTAVRCSSDVGRSGDGRIMVSPKQAREFTLTITPRQGENK